MNEAINSISSPGTGWRENPPQRQRRYRESTNLLTARENEIAGLAATGLQVKQIAYRLGITHGTAKVHLHNLYTKLGINSRVELVLVWTKLQQAS